MHQTTNTDTVTTILTTYRRPKLLKRAILSVLRQSYQDIRVLVLDDASGDETEDIVTDLARQDSRIQYVKHPQNIGMTPNWRYGLEHVETPYFSFLSDDDLHLPDFYSTAIGHLSANPQIDFFCGSTVIFDEHGNIGRVSTDGWTEGVYSPPGGMLKMMERPISWNGIVFRQRVVDQIGTLKDIHSTDFEFLIRCARECSFAVINTPCAMFMEHSGRAWGHTNVLKVFHQFFPMIVGLLAGTVVFQPEVQAKAWAIMNQRAITMSKYMFLDYMVRGQIADALNMALFLHRLAPRSIDAFKFIALAKLARWFPSIVVPYVRRRIFRRTAKSQHTTIRQQEYAWCLEIAQKIEE